MANPTPSSDVKRNPFGDYFEERQLKMGLTNREMASHLGYKNANFISMVKSGATRFPLIKLAQARALLDADMVKLFQLYIDAYMPETRSLFDQILSEKTQVTANELAVLEVWRTATDYKDPAITQSKDNVERVLEKFREATADL